MLETVSVLEHLSPLENNLFEFYYRMAQETNDPAEAATYTKEATSLSDKAQRLAEEEAERLAEEAAAETELQFN